MSMNRAATTRNGVGPSTVVVAASNFVGYTDATGKVTFTIVGPANPLNAGADKDTDTVTLTCTGCTITAGEGPLTGVSGFMTQASEVLTFAIEYLDTTLAADITTLTQTASTSGLTATTRTVTATSYDQFGDPVSGNAIAFTSVMNLHQGALSATATELFTLAGHGLSVGDDITVLVKGNAVGVTLNEAVALAAGQTFYVETVPSTSTFTLKNSAGSQLNITTAGVEATPMTFTTTSTASASRTTNASGQATYSWSDSETTSAKDTITADPATGANATVVHYRLAASADFITTDSTGASDANLDDNMRLALWDNATNTITVELFDGTVVTHPTTTYQSFTYDDNDQFATGAAMATPNGNQVTMAAFETRLTAICAAPPTCTGLVANDIVYINGWTGLSTAIVRYSTD